LKTGEHPKVVAERLGHASVKTTLDLYSHVIETMEKSAADKMDALFGKPMANR
jgi:integrase